MNEKRMAVTEEELTKPLPSGGEMKDLELLPDREWLKAEIKDVKLQISYYNNKPVTKKDKNDNEILDENGEPIYRREFAITFALKDYKLPNDEPRKVWLNLTASLGKQAKLPKFLESVFGQIEYDGLTPKQIIDNLKHIKRVKLQMQNRTSKAGKVYQMPVYDAIRQDTE